MSKLLLPSGPDVTQLFRDTFLGLVLSWAFSPGTLSPSPSRLGTLTGRPLMWHKAVEVAHNAVREDNGLEGSRGRTQYSRWTRRALDL